MNVYECDNMNNFIHWKMNVLFNSALHRWIERSISQLMKFILSPSFPFTICIYQQYVVIGIYQYNSSYLTLTDKIWSRWTHLIPVTSKLYKLTKNCGTQGNNIVPYNSKLKHFLKKLLAIHQEILQVVQNIVSASKLKLLSCTLSCHFKESEHIVTTVQKQQTN